VAFPASLFILRELGEIGWRDPNKGSQKLFAADQVLLSNKHKPKARSQKAFVFDADACYHLLQSNQVARKITQTILSLQIRTALVHENHKRVVHRVEPICGTTRGPHNENRRLPLCHVKEIKWAHTWMHIR
jgi:hypothetical protein